MKIGQPTQRMAKPAFMAFACAAVWMIGSGMSTAQGPIARQAVPRRAVLPERLPKPVQVEPAGGRLQTDAQGRQFLVGKLAWHDLEGGFWQLNGFVLGNPPQLKGFKAGETARVFGRAAPPNQASTTQAGPVFHVTFVQRLAPDQPAEPPKLTDEQVTQVKKLVADLGSSDFQTREAAEEALRKIGPGALPYVREQAKSPDAEVGPRRPVRGVNPVMDRGRNLQGLMQMNGDAPEGVRPFVGIVSSNAVAFELMADK